MRCKVLGLESEALKAISEQEVASFPGLSCFYVRLVHAKHGREEKFEKRERPGTISHVR